MTDANEALRVRERDIAQMEDEMIHAETEYFNARPQLFRTIEKDRIFEAGFKAAWEASSHLTDPGYVRVPEGVCKHCLPLVGEDLARRCAAATKGQAMTDMTIGSHYRFVGMPEKLVYLGHNWSGNGYCHQFARADIPDCPVWAEITDSELNLIEGWTDD